MTAFMVTVVLVLVALLVLVGSFVLMRRSRDEIHRIDDENLRPPARDIEFATRAGKPLRVDELRGHASLLVNVPTHDADPRELEGLTALTERYATSDLEVLALPIGDEDEVAESTLRAAGSIPVLAPARRHPLADRMEAESASLDQPYTKVVIDRKNRVLARFGPQTSPYSAQLGRALDEAIQ